MVCNTTVPLISVIFPVYNSGKSICTCLQSLLASTYKNLEILVVYRPSQDDTLAQINSFQDSRIKILTQTTPNGPGGARNMGLEAATGEFIGFMEVEDQIAPNFYELLLNRIVADQSDIAWGHMYENNVPRPFYQTQTVTGFFSSYKLLSNGACFDKLFRATLIKNLRFYKNYRFEDNPFILQAFFAAKKVSLVPQAKYYYHPSVWTPAYRKYLIASVCPIAQEMIQFITTRSAFHSEINLVKRQILRCFAHSFILEGIYPQLSEILGRPLFLTYFYYKRKLQYFRHQLFHRGEKHD